MRMTTHKVKYVYLVLGGISSAVRDGVLTITFHVGWRTSSGYEPEVITLPLDDHIRRVLSEYASMGVLSHESYHRLCSSVVPYRVKLSSPCLLYAARHARGRVVPLMPDVACRAAFDITLGRVRSDTVV